MSNDDIGSFQSREKQHITNGNSGKTVDFETAVSSLDLSNVSTQNFPEYVLGKINSQRRMSEGTFLSTRPRYGKKFESSPNIEVVDESGQKVDEENLVKFLSRTNTPSVRDENETYAVQGIDEPVQYTRKRRRSSMLK